LITILITGGGTGGHLSPGVALYQSFKEKEVRALFLASNRDRRFSSLQEINKQDLYLYPAPVLSKNIFKLIIFLPLFLLSFFKAIRVIKQNNVQGVVGMGGYVSAPALLAAIFSKIPLFLCEQNSVPGKVTVWFEKYALKVYGTFALAKDYLKFDFKFKNLGNPLRRHIIVNKNKEEAKKFFNLGHTKKIILVIGGSQGALRVNELFFEMRKKYADDFKDFGVIWSLGDYSYPRFKSKIEQELKQGSIYISPYIKQVGLAYKAADIVIGRSGSGVMMEIAVNALPAIFIPYPYALKDHQTKNAAVFSKAGAAINLSEKDLTADKLASALLGLLNNKPALNQMSQRALAVSSSQAGDLISVDILDNLKVNKTPKRITDKIKGENIV